MLSSYFSFHPLNLRSNRDLFVSEAKDIPKDGKWINLHGENILYHSIHDGGRFISEEMLESVYRQQEDPEVDDIIKLLDKEGIPLGPSQDLLEMADQCYEKKQQQHQQNESSLSKADIAMAKFYEHYKMKIFFNG